MTAAEDAVRPWGIRRFEAWTRDDPWVQRWYESHGFVQVSSYLHVYLHGRDELDGVIASDVADLKPIKVFAHYTGDQRDEIRARFERVHDCVLYERRFSPL